MSIFLFICLVAIIGALTARMAKRKNRDPVLWFWLGAMFGLIALIALYFLKDPKEQKSLVSKEDPLVPVEDEKKLNGVGVWYILDQKRATLGPFSFDDIRTMFQEGSLSASSYLWHEEWTDWKIASEVPGLHKSLLLDQGSV